MELKILDMFRLGRDLEDYSVLDLIEFYEELESGNIMGVYFTVGYEKRYILFYNYMEDLVEYLEEMLRNKLIPETLLVDFNTVEDDEIDNYLYIDEGVAIHLDDLMYERMEL